MSKIWYILLDGESEGPLSYHELRRHPKITPFTLVWRKGFEKWIAIKDVPELQELFIEEKPEEDEQKKEETLKPFPDDELTITLEPSQPPYMFYILIVITLILILLIYQILW